jgi:hypothetical protein
MLENLRSRGKGKVGRAERGQVRVTGWSSAREGAYTVYAAAMYLSRAGNWGKRGGTKIAPISGSM